MYYTWDIDWRWLIINISILIGTSVIVNIIDWYFQMYIVKHCQQKILVKIMKNRSYSRNFNLTKQANIIVNLKKEWIFYCSVLNVFVIIFMPLFLMLLNNLILTGKLLSLIFIFIYFLLLNLYEINYNNQHIVLKDDEYQVENVKNEIFIALKTKKNIKYFIKKIINFIPLYLGFFGLIANIVISYITLNYLYDQPFNKIIAATNRNGIWVFFTSYNYIHIILHNFLILLFLTWLMQLILFYLLDLNTLNKNKKRLLIQIFCFLNIFAILSFILKLFLKSL